MKKNTSVVIFFVLIIYFVYAYGSAFLEGIFVIPEFLIGVPRYDTAACTAYIMDELIKNGFHIKYTHQTYSYTDMSIRDTDQNK